MKNAMALYIGNRKLVSFAKENENNNLS